MVMKHGYSFLFSPLHFLVDIAILNLSFFLAIWIRFDLIRGDMNIPVHHYKVLWLVFNLAWFIILAARRPYRYKRTSFNINTLLNRLFVVTALHVGLVILFVFLVQGYYFSRGQLAICYVIFVFLAVIARLVGLFVVKTYRIKGFNKRNYIIVGYGELSESITAFYETNPDMGYVFRGFFDAESGITKLGSEEIALDDYISEYNIDYIYCCQPYLTNEQISKVVAVAEKHKAELMLVIDFRGFLTNKAELEYHDYMPVIRITTKAFSNVRSEVTKRVFDVVFSTAVFLAGWPVFLAVAILVRLTSKGPVFFMQKRSGRWGKTFYIYKFRSMYVNADEIAQQHSKGDDDPRITPIGKILRKTRLDELPQFFNVLKGDMSVVGPRPLADYDVHMLMEGSPAAFRRILTMRPGITSIGQIKVGYADNIDESTRRLKYDLLYLDNVNLKTDIWLIAQTVLLMIQRKGK